MSPDAPAPPHSSTASPSARSSPETRSCANCGAPLYGPYCAECGQEAEHRIQPMRRLVREVMDEVLELDFRIWRTVRHLVVPGALSRAHLGGRRVGHVRPFRLFVLTSVVLLVAFSGGRKYAQTHLSAGPLLRIEISEAEAEAKQSHIDSLRQTGATWPAVKAAFLEDLVDSRDEIDTVNRFYFEWLTVPLAFMVPLYAALLKAAYRTRLYAEHLVVSLHLHAALFLWIAGLIAVSVATHAWFGGGNAAAPLGLGGCALAVLYTVVSMRRIYGGSWAGTILKGAGLALVYAVCFAGMASVYGMMSIMLA